METTYAIISIMKVYWRTLKEKYTKDKDDFPFGMRFYDAPQGGGKSLTMVFDALELKRRFPDMITISNIIIKGLKNQRNFETIDELIFLLEKSQNLKHTLVIIDEALTYFAENGGIDPALMNKITQNRKCRRFMMIATQIFKRVNNRLRDFSLETVVCRSFWFLQINTVRDDTTLHWDKKEMDFVGRKKYTYVFKRNNKLFDSYNTFASVKLNTQISTASLFTPSPAPPLATSERASGLFNKKGKK